MESIIIRKIEKPAGQGVNDALQWFCDSLGLLTRRDRDNSCYRLFIELLKSSKKGKALSSDELASRLNLVRGTVVHHLNRLIEAGLVESEGNRYSLKARTLKGLVGLLKKEVDDALGNVELVAERLDRSI